MPWVLGLSSAATLSFWGLLYWTWQRPFTHYDAVPLFFVVGSLVLLLLLGRQVPWPVWLWWGWGAASTLWSLAPGSSFQGSLWELGYVAAFAAGAAAAKMLWSYATLNAALLANQLFSAVSLASFGLSTFFSGSLHYVLGAQALVIIPPLLYAAFKSRWQLVASIALAVALYAALISGARAVYLPLLLLLPLAVLGLWRERVPLWRLGAVLGAVALLVWGFNAASQNPNLQSATNKLSLQAQTSSFSAQGAFTTRLQMWEQTWQMALKHPLGTGNASFREVLPAYILYPTVTFNSAHNYYLETLSTGGWPRFLLLLGLLLWLFLSRLRPHWPWVLSAAGLWATLAFDVTGYYPGVMMLAFGALGLLYALPQQHPPHPQRPLAWAMLTLATLMALWWFWPCQGNACVTQRYFAQRLQVETLLPKLPANQQQNLLQQTLKLNQSFWVYSALYRYAQTPQQQLQYAREISQRFPKQTPNSYLFWAKAALATGNRAEARQALQQGLSVFPPSLAVAGVPLDLNNLTQWFNEAAKLQQELDTP